MGEFRFSDPILVTSEVSFSFPLDGVAPVRIGLELLDIPEFNDKRELANQPRLVGAGVAELVAAWSVVVSDGRPTTVLLTESSLTGSGDIERPGSEVVFLEEATPTSLPVGSGLAWN